MLQKADNYFQDRVRNEFLEVMSETFLTCLVMFSLLTFGKYEHFIPGGWWSSRFVPEWGYPLPSSSLAGHVVRPSLSI